MIVYYSKVLKVKYSLLRRSMIKIEIRISRSSIKQDGKKYFFEICEFFIELYEALVGIIVSYNQACEPNFQSSFHTLIEGTPQKQVLDRGIQQHLLSRKPGRES